MKHFLLQVFALISFAHSFAQTGIPVPEMTQTDNLITTFLNTYNIPGATAAIAKDGKIVYMRAFGYSDINKTTLTQPNNLFRIASLSKQITAITIMKLIEQGRLTLSSKVFGAAGVLKDHPVFSVANITDARIYDITIQNLLEHAGGWNRDFNCNPNPTSPYPYFQDGCDPISFPLRVTQVTGTPNPMTKEALIKFLLEKGLDFVPGTSYNYSNGGFLMLGEVIEKITGKTYETYVKDSILAPLGIYDMHIANNLLSGKQEREGEYVGNGYNTYSCYGDNTIVPWEYGGFSVNAMGAHGGWIASSRDMLKLLTAVDGFATKPDMLLPATISSMVTPSANYTYYAKGWAVNPSNNWWHTGSLDGTASEQVRSSTGYTWIFILNKRNITQGSFWSALDNLGWNCISATSTWPSFDLMASPTQNAATVSFSNVAGTSVTVNWTGGNGDKRLLLVKEGSPVNAYPLDGTDYTGNGIFGAGAALGNNTYVAYNGTGNSAAVTGLTPNKNYYFRVVEYNENTVTGNNALYLLGNNPTASQTTPLPLPVDFLGFTATKLTGKQVRLDWQTAREIDNDHFELQRSSDGATFSSIGSIPGTNNSTVTSSYSFTDKEPFATRNFYRVKQVDKDGSAIYSFVIPVIFSTEGAVYLTPNPANDYVSVKGDNIQEAILMDLTGKILLRKKVVNGADNRFNIASLPKGVYMVKVLLQDGYSETKRLVVR